MSEQERRDYKRVDVEFNVRLAREVENNQFMDLPIDVAKSVNVSASGMLLNVREPLDIREMIRVTFLKPNTFEFFEGLARVIRIEENDDKSYKVGLNFFNLSTSELKKLDYYISLCD